MVEFKTQDGKELCEPFLQLPSRKDLPDYYHVSAIREIDGLPP